MSFEAELQSVVDRVDGAQAAALMGFDGIPVAEAKAEGVRVPYQEIGVEFSRVLKEASKATLGTEVGGLHEMVLSTDKNQFLLRVLNDEYFLFLMLSPKANAGQGRYFLRRAAPGICQEL